MVVRRATAADAARIGEVFLRARAEMTYLPRLHSDGDTRAYFRDVVLASDEVWVADEPPVTGFAALGESMLEHLYVDPAAQGRGLGTALLERARVERPDGLELWVFQRNVGARRFYERHGFELVLMTDGAGNEEREPDAKYGWKPRSGRGGS
jgi:GNAT superfamily N-acetyltransferase